MKTVFLRVLEAEDKATALRGAIREPERALGRQRFEVNPGDFVLVPGTAFAYWVGRRILSLFRSGRPLEDMAEAWVGLQTNDDFRWIRTWWESPTLEGEQKAVPFAKGGAYSRFYADVNLSVQWGTDGRRIKEWKVDQLRQGLITANNSRCWNEKHYFRAGITWPSRTQRFGARVLPAGCVFGHKGPAAFAQGENALTLLALMSCDAFLALLETRLNAADATARSYEVGIVRKTPLPDIDEHSAEALVNHVRRAWSLKRSLDTRTEISHAFTLPALLQVTGADVAARAAAWSEHVRTVEADLAGLQAEIDERCFVLYGMDEADRSAITEGFVGHATEAAAGGEAEETEDDAGEDGEGDDSAGDLASLAADIVSWAVGVAFGRFDMRLATGRRPMPTEPEPFDPLPACSSGMLTGGDGLPLARPPAGYPLAFPEAGVLVDDHGHVQDLPTAVRAVFDVVFGADADRWWDDVAALLDPKGHDLRVWLAGSFFDYHLKRHSKSRRKAPILWQFGTPSGRYSVWLYAHRLTRDSFFQIQNEVVGPKLAHEERQLTSLMQNAGGSPSPTERKQIAAQGAFVEELRAMLDQVKRVAPLWNPNLDDGVVLTMAPLWRLVPQHKPWQKELKGKWDELAARKYDWAHLAMHLWPERVVPKCATDRSLAIAHDLEEVFWVEGADGKWKARTTPLKSVEELVRERRSPAVESALKSLLDAPTASGTGRPSGRRATTSAAADGGGR